MLEIQTLETNKITPYENNAKKHPKEQIEQIKESIKEFGFDDPIAVWGKDNIIVEGHGRYYAAKELGLDTVPVIRLDHLSDEQRRAYTLIHNQLTLNSGFDLDMLSLELDSLDSFDLDLYGFKLPEQKINSGQEIDTEEFGDDKFECRCPRCGFVFNREDSE